LQATLIRKGHGAEAVRHALSRLQDLGYLDDAAYARALARRVVERQRGGPGRVRQVLAARGLPPGLVAEAAAEAFAERDEATAALAAGRRRLAGLRGLPPEVIRRRLAGHLSRGGYSAEAVAQALRALLGSAPGGDPGGDAGDFA
jgi:regulatory protein